NTHRCRTGPAADGVKGTICAQCSRTASTRNMNATRTAINVTGKKETPLISYIASTEYTVLASTAVVTMWCEGFSICGVTPEKTSMKTPPEVVAISPMAIAL